MKDFINYPFVVKSHLEPKCKKISKSAKMKVSTYNLARNWREIFPITRATKFTITINRRKVFPISFHYVLTSFEHQVLDLAASQKLQVFLTFEGQKLISGTNSATNKQDGHMNSVFITQKTTTAVKREEDRKTVSIEKT